MFYHICMAGGSVFSCVVDVSLLFSFCSLTALCHAAADPIK